MKRDRIIGIILLILGALIALTPSVIAPTCGPMENGMFMKCHWMGRAVNATGVIIAIIGGAYAYVCSSKAKFALAFSNCLVGIYTILLPLYLIGGCKNPEMACRAKTMPLVYILSGLVVIITLVAMYLNRNKDAARCE